ncbi:MAG: S41 family peptidase, partial [Candidatus Portnoybacteria bacterium]|nr:S41 family peptidase [Candidatus Portnoybacteria bacterium]
SAEIMTATLKKYNVGIFVGEKTRGWGTIEKVFEIKNQISDDEKYGMFLVHSLTLGDDNQPIESNGVKPLINITDKDWKQQLFNYFHSTDLNSAVEKIWNTAI